MGERAYLDWTTGNTSPDTITVHEVQREAVVAYPKPNGGTFKLKVRQKPNPIGFHARLPGDGRAA